MHLILMLVVLVNVGVNVLQGATFGISGRFPAVYAGCVMTGQSLGGLIPAAVAVVLTSATVEAPILGPAAFVFVVSFIVMAHVLFYKLSKNRYFLYHTEIDDTHEANHDSEVDQICYKQIVASCWPYLVTGFVNYATSLCVFPAITSLGKKTVYNL